MLTARPQHTLAKLGQWALIVVAVSWTYKNASALYRAESKEPAGPDATVANWRTYAQGGQRLGPTKAIVTVVVFSDYQCSFCKTANRMLAELREQYPTAVAEIIRQYPLPGHAAAHDAAVGAECAAEVGQFGSYNDDVFRGADSLVRWPITRYASEAGVRDTIAFRACMRSMRTSLAVATDISEGKRLRVRRTPTILVNDDMYEGLPPDFKHIVMRKLRRLAKGSD